MGCVSLQHQDRYSFGDERKTNDKIIAEFFDLSGTWLPLREELFLIVNSPLILFLDGAFEIQDSAFASYIGLFVSQINDSDLIPIYHPGV